MDVVKVITRSESGVCSMFLVVSGSVVARWHHPIPLDVTVGFVEIMNSEKSINMEKDLSKI
jgi:hypothetical protein